MSQNAINNEKIIKEHRNFISNSLYSFLYNYGAVVLDLLTTFIIARLISQALWGFLILSTSYILIITLILTFIPPAMNIALNYYIPRYTALNKRNKLRNFVKYSILLKLMFLIPIFIISIFVFDMFRSIFALNLKEYTYLLFILSPIIIVSGLEHVIDGINRGFNKFNIILYILLIRKAMYFGGIFYIFLFQKNIQLETLAFITLLSNIVPFVLNILLITITYLKIGKSEEKGITLIEVFRKIFNYGSLISLATLSGHLVREAELQSIGLFESSSKVIGFSIAIQFQGFTLNSADSFSFPLINSFSSFFSQKDYEQINNIFRIIVKSSLIIICLFSGMLFFFTDFILFAFLGRSYLIFSPILKLFQIALVFRVLDTPLDSLIRGLNKTKYQPYLTLITVAIKIPLFFYGLINFGLIGAIIFGLIISQILIFIVNIIFIKRIFKINLKLFRILWIFLFFYFSMGFALFLEMFFLEQIRITLLDIMNIPIFSYIQFFGFGIYLLVFICLLLAFKMIKVNEIEFLESVFAGDKKFNKIICKILFLIKKLIRK